MRSRLLSAMVSAAIASSAVAQTPAATHNTASIQLVEQAPVSITKLASGAYLVDFGRVAFGNLSLASTSSSSTGTITVRLGEALQDGRVDTHPPGSVRYSEITATLPLAADTVIAPPADSRNTSGHAVLTPPAWGVLMPFRWAEISGWPTELHPADIRRRASFDSTWQDDAATFHSSDAMLNQVWELCHDSIKATTFAGIFVDGNRERLPYEADAFLSQLGYYAGDADPRLVRATFDRLLAFPTWPSEWTPHMVFIAYADWQQTGDKLWLAAQYERLKTKLLEDRVGPDGLVTSTAAQIRHGDLVDWPAGERDGYVFTSVNTVVNAFRLRALQRMSELAKALGKTSEAAAFAQQRQSALAVFQQKLFDPARGLYRDGIGTDHAALHASLFPLAFDLVPVAQRSALAQRLATRGMPVSVYAAQHLLEALFENGEQAAALALITAPGDRSWRHMVESGATITWEAWDQKYKPNQDWNHAWGAAPANLLPRYVLGAQPAAPGWSRALIQPHPGTLTFAEGHVPTPRGEMSVNWTQGKRFTLSLALPAGMTAKVILPAMKNSTGVWLRGTAVKAHREGSWWTLDQDVAGNVTIEER